MYRYKWISKHVVLAVVFVFVSSIAIYFMLSVLDRRDAASGERADTIQDFDVTWVFDGPVRFGRFANGHYWVVGPVTVNKILPAGDGRHHGWEVNPNDVERQGFDSRIADFDATHIPELPYRASGGQSLVKVVSLDPTASSDCRPCIKSASVLTVLDRVPPDNGQTVFRPPYFGNKKPLISTAGLQIKFIPQLARTKSAPSFDEIADRYKMVQLDHKVGWTGRKLHPADAMPDYGSDIGSRNAASLLALMLKGDDSAKWDSIVRYVNNGIDIYYMFLQGVDWPADGGHGEGRKLPAVFAAVLLGDSSMVEILRKADNHAFGETGGIYKSENTKAILFGQVTAPEEQYWRSLVYGTGSRTIIDPYFFIDGGEQPGKSYQHCCTAKSWKATATALLLMPALRQAFQGEDLLQYVRRWVKFGAWTQPDPCAPANGLCVGGDNPGTACSTANEDRACKGDNAICDVQSHWAENYQITYGPDGQGSCIRDKNPRDGIGRFPLSHGTGADGGYHGDNFADEMWVTHAAHLF